MKEKPCVLIMAGGSGTRFWPLSTSEMPKQFLTLYGQRSMLQHTFDRVSFFIPKEQIFIITSDRHVETVKLQLPELDHGNIIGEVVGRDTAAAVTLGASVIRQKYSAAALLVLPADHLIREVEKFSRCIEEVIDDERLRNGDPFCFGVKPEYPEVNYGYIHSPTLGEVLSFKEKPDYIRASEMVDSGEYYWNAGIYCWRIDSLWKALQFHLPQHVSEIESHGSNGYFNLPKISIDCGVIEKYKPLWVKELSSDWNDLGNWPAVEKLYVSHRGNCLTESNNSFIFCEDAKETVVLVGVDDVIVVRSGNRTLIIKKSEISKLKSIVKEIP